MKKSNFIKTLAVAALLKILNPLDANAQNYHNIPIDSKSIELTQPFENREESVRNSYYNLLEFSKRPGATTQQARQILGRDISNIEAYLGREEEFYHGSGGRYMTQPKEGFGSIQIVDGKLFVTSDLVGSGYGKKATGKYDAETQYPVDMTTTWENYAGMAKYNVFTSDRNADKLREVITYNYPVSMQEQDVQYSTSGNITEVAYTGSAKKDFVSKYHAKIGETTYRTINDTIWTGTSTANAKAFPNAIQPRNPCDSPVATPCDELLNGKPGQTKTAQAEYKIVKRKVAVSRGEVANHILQVPGRTHFFPLEDVLTISNVDFETYYTNLNQQQWQQPSTTQNPQQMPIYENDRHQRKDDCRDCQDEKLIMVYDDECHDCGPEIKRDSLIRRMYVLAGGTSTKMPFIRRGMNETGPMSVAPVFGIGGQFTTCEFWNRFDLEAAIAGAGFEGTYNLVTEESKVHPETGFKGVSKLTERGESEVRSHRAYLGVVRYVNKRNSLGIRAGVTGTWTNQSIIGDENRETWYIDNNGKRIKYDQADPVEVDAMVRSKLKFNPYFGAQMSLTPRVRVFADYTLNSVPYISDYSQNVDFGSVRAGLIIDFGKSRDDEHHSNAAVNRQKVIDMEMKRQNYSYPVPQNKVIYVKPSEIPKKDCKDCNTHTYQYKY